MINILDSEPLKREIIESKNIETNSKTEPPSNEITARIKPTTRRLKKYTKRKRKTPAPEGREPKPPALTAYNVPLDDTETSL